MFEGSNDDTGTKKVQKCIQEKGIERAIEKVCCLKRDKLLENKLFELIKKIYNQIKLSSYII